MSNPRHSWYPQIMKAVRCREVDCSQRYDCRSVEQYDVVSSKNVIAPAFEIIDRAHVPEDKMGVGWGREVEGRCYVHSIASKDLAVDRIE